jgi:hypothetical protein
VAPRALDCFSLFPKFNTNKPSLFSAPQYMNRDKSKTLREQWCFSRTASMFCIGALAAAPVLLTLNRWMDANVLVTHASSPLVGGLKFFLDQVVGCFIWQVRKLRMFLLPQATQPLRSRHQPMAASSTGCVHKH